MALPQPSFKVVVNANKATFVNTTISDSPLTLVSWEFGDAHSIETNDSPVEHEYSAMGIFIVKLTVTNATGSAFTTQTLLIISALNNGGMPISEMVKCKVPFPDSACTQNVIRKWQLMLQRGPYPAIPDSDVYDESKWPYAFNILIGELAAYEALVNTFNSFALQGAELSLAQAMKILSSSESSTTSPSESPKRILKRLQTGPSEAEWFNPTDSSSVESGARLLMAYFSKKDGLLTEYKQMICAWASRLDVFLPTFCECSNLPILPQIAKVCK